MPVKTFFHLDCGPVISECGHRCDKCVREILTVLEGTDGVRDASMGMHGEISGIVVDYDPQMTDERRLTAALGALPTFYKGKFIPKVLGD